MISNIFIIIGVTLFISKLIITQFNKNKPTKINVNNPNYCILVPARNESRVIEDLLLSIKSQTQKVPFENVYIIVEDKNDPTTKIAKKYNEKTKTRTKKKRICSDGSNRKNHKNKELRRILYI